MFHDRPQAEFIGRPQVEFVRLARLGEIRGRVLDAETIFGNNINARFQG